MPTVRNTLSGPFAGRNPFDIHFFFKDLDGLRLVSFDPVFPDVKLLN
jgi:hypothetical protein